MSIDGSRARIIAPMVASGALGDVRAAGEPLGYALVIALQGATPVIYTLKPIDFLNN